MRNIYPRSSVRYHFPCEVSHELRDKVKFEADTCEATATLKSVSACRIPTLDVLGSESLIAPLNYVNMSRLLTVLPVYKTRMKRHA